MRDSKKKKIIKKEQLPRKEKFYSSQTCESISDKEYEHALD